MMSKTFEHGHALIIGCGADLPETVDGAVGLADILTARERCAYPVPQVHLLTEERATRTSILTKLDDLAKLNDPQATIIFYFSGHGYRLSSSSGVSYYLMPYGYNTAQLAQTAISGSEIAQKIQAIAAQKLLLLFDCCYAGGVGEERTFGLRWKKSPLPPETLALLTQGSGKAIIASSTEDELSYGGKPYSAFTTALIEGLCGKGAARKDGFVRVADLALHARQVVPGRTKNCQHPVLHFEQANNFIVAYYAAGDKKAKELPFAIQPEVEPEPGVWRKISQTNRSLINSIQFGNGATIQGNVFTGGKHEFHFGNISGSEINIAGKDILKPQQAGGLPEFIQLLSEIRCSLAGSGLDQDSADAITKDIETVVNQAEKDQPKKAIILSKLKGIAELLAVAGGVATAAQSLAPLVQKAIEMAQQLF
jgi:hypothetical protein